MKGSKKIPHQEKGSGSNKSAIPPTKGSPLPKVRQSVKVKYGVDDESDLPPMPSSPSPVAHTFKKSNTSPVSRRAKIPNSPTGGNLKPKSKSSPTKGNDSTNNKAPSRTSSTLIPTQKRNQQALPRKGECEICRQPCRSHCAGCKRVFYCSKQHQQADWSKHKLICRPFSIPSQYSSGFHLQPPGTSASSSSSLNIRDNNKYYQTSSGIAAAPETNLSPELQFMISTKHIPAGSVLFTEKPLLVVANVFGDISNGNTFIWCCSCLKAIPNTNDALNNNTGAAEQSASCPICQVPLCNECVRHLGNTTMAGASKAFYAGQGHSAEECALISDLCQKAPEVMSFISSCNDSKCAADLMKDLTILRVLMFRTTCLWRWESLMALRSSPRFRACCKHNFGNLEGWLGCSPEYSVSTYYLKNICKEKNIVLADIVKIIAVFCEVSVKNPSLLVLYENLSWLAHACTPNAEKFFRQAQVSDVEDSSSQLSTLDILVKAVNAIAEGSKITVNYLTSFESGRSALALRLFQNKGHYCCDTECVCHQSRSFDKTMGIRCDLIFSTHACSGILSPRVDPPNPDKPNLGLGMFMKSKKWECDKCKKSEKYDDLHPKIMEIAQDLTAACDRCCNSSCSAGGLGKTQPPFLQLQSKLLYHLSDEHWMVWKAKLRILKSWTSSFGYGTAMMRSILTLQRPSTSLQTAHRTGLIYVLKQKVEMYGDGIYTSDTKVKNKMGVLELLAKRHGPLSPKRGHLLFDAFYANLIVLVEDYKKELPLPHGQSDLKRCQVAKEYCKKMTILRNLLVQTVESLKVTEGTTLGQSSAKPLQIAKRSLEVIEKVCSKVEQHPNLIISYLNDLLEVYACQDPDFIISCVRKSQLKTDPFRQGFVGDDCLDFEVDNVNFGASTTVSFGPATILSSLGGVSKSSSSSNFTFGASGIPGNYQFGFSEFGSPSFGMSDLDSCSDYDDDDDNPFIYSRKPKSKSNPKQNARERTYGSKSNSSASGKKRTGDEDMSSYFWFSSDDDDGNDNPFNDEFDIGFASSPRSPFGGDLFNDQELEDLAEWAALQFMMGKMKL